MIFFRKAFQLIFLLVSLVILHFFITLYLLGIRFYYLLFTIYQLRASRDLALLRAASVRVAPLSM